MWQLAVEIEYDRPSNQLLTGGIVDSAALVRFYGAPLITVEAMVENVVGVREVSAVGGGEHHPLIVGVTDDGNDVHLPDRSAPALLLRYGIGVDPP